jgi:undecaprenyl diphosphate synthase
VSNVPSHLGFIVDGNRRWAKLHGISRDVHRQGKDVVYDVALKCFDAGIKYATFYIFSSENWQRDKKEVSYLMKLFAKSLGEEIDRLHANEVKLVFLGVDERIDAATLRAMREAEKATEHYTKGTLAMCFNYGGQQEIADAARKIVESGAKSEEVTPELVAQHIYHPEIPPVDMVVRTGGEQRISNFMLWRVAYAEFMFIEKLWPDMTTGDVDEIIKEYIKRDRRYGK